MIRTTPTIYCDRLGCAREAELPKRGDALPDGWRAVDLSHSSGPIACSALGSFVKDGRWPVVHLCDRHDVVAEVRDIPQPVGGSL